MSLSFAQFTDLHLRNLSDENAERFKKCLKFIQPFNPDFLLLTGDLIKTEEAAEGYETLKILLKESSIPYHVVLGNHDNWSAFQKTFKEIAPLKEENFYYTFETPVAHFIGLNTKTPQHHYGSLSETQLTWLDHTLASFKKPAVLFMHHPPLGPKSFNIPTLNPYFKQFTLKGYEPFLEICKKYQIANILSGHIHYALSLSSSSYLFTISPSIARCKELKEPEKKLLTQAGLLASFHPGVTLYRFNEVSKRFNFTYFFVP